MRKKLQKRLSKRLFARVERKAIRRRSNQNKKMYRGGQRL